jgi:acetylornithine deacetylase
MLRVLLHLWQDLMLDWEKSEIVYSIREMSSSRAGFVVPDRCETWIDLHIDFDFASSGYNLGTDNPLAHVLPAIYRSLGLPLRLDAFRSHSDGNLFFAAGTKPIILGPGALETAHTPEEQVIFSEVSAAANIYAALCLEMD